MHRQNQDKTSPNKIVKVHMTLKLYTYRRLFISLEPSSRAVVVFRDPLALDLPLGLDAHWPLGCKLWDPGAQCS